MSGLILTVTNAGRAALVNAANTGTNAVLMASVGVSATSFTPTSATTALPGEIKRISTIAGEAVANDTIHVTVRDESSAVYTVRSFGLYLSDGTLFAVYSQANPIMEKSAQAMLLLAIDVAFADINAAQIAFGDTSFLNPPATTERQGVVELATDAEATAGADAVRAVTPKGLKAAVTSWLDTRFGSGAPSAFVKTLLTSASAAALRTSLAIKSAALKDEGSGNGLDADLLDGQHGSYYSNVVARLGYTPWGPGNDGSGSGLDADLLDGLHASAFARLSGASFTGSIAVPPGYGLLFGDAASISLASSGGDLLLRGGTSATVFRNSANTVSNMVLFDAGNLTVLGQITSAGSIVWTAGNDGAGSGLDADLLDGLHASSFLQTTGGTVSGTVTFANPVNGSSIFTHPGDSAKSGYLGFFTAEGRQGFIGYAADGGFIPMNAERAAGWAVNKSLSVGGALTRGGNIVWDAGNDGSGSGLDADLLDGLHASAFAQLSGATFTGAVNISGSGIQRPGTPAGTFFGSEVNGNWLMRAGGGTFRIQNAAGTLNIFQASAAGAQVLEQTVWTAGNDGSGSGLDADMLDGLHATAFARLTGADFTGIIRAGLGASSYASVQPGDPTHAGYVAFATSEGRHGFIGFSEDGGFIPMTAERAAGWAINKSLTVGLSITRAGNTVWDAGNDGSGSGLDADLLDGQQGSYYLPASSYSAADVKAKLLTVDGSGSGVDADMLDGLHASDFQRVTSQNMAALNGYRVYADGTKECWTSLTIAQHSNATWTLPVAHTEFVHPSFAISTANGITDVQDNTGITSINGSPPVSITFWNADNRTITIWVRTIGR